MGPIVYFTNLYWPRQGLTAHAEAKGSTILKRAGGAQLDVVNILSSHFHRWPKKNRTVRSFLFHTDQTSKDLNMLQIQENTLRNKNLENIYFAMNPNKSRVD